MLQYVKQPVGSCCVPQGAQPASCSGTTSTTGVGPGVGGRFAKDKMGGAVKIKIRMKLKHRGGVDNSEKTSEVLYLFIDLSFLSFVVMESISILGRLGLE